MTLIKCSATQGDLMNKKLAAYQVVISVFLCFLLLLTTSGCATISRIIKDLQSTSRIQDSLIYAGTKHHLHEIPLYSTRNRNHWASQIAYSFRWWHYVDLPLCFVADTVLLPYTIPRTWYTRRKAQPTKEETAIRPVIKEYSACCHNMRSLEAGKLKYARHHDLGVSGKLPQDLDIYRTQIDFPYNKGPFYICPAEGEYRVGARGEEPACSVHSTLSEASATLDFICKEHRLPEPLSKSMVKKRTEQNITNRNSKTTPDMENK